MTKQRKQLRQLIADAPTRELMLEDKCPMYLGDSQAALPDGLAIPD